jgi:hypothetical protein
MASKLTFKLTLLFDQQVDDPGNTGGNWQYAGADAVERGTRRKAQLIATKRTNSANGTSFPVSMLTATLIFPARGDRLPANLTLQGCTT